MVEGVRLCMLSFLASIHHFKSYSDSYFGNICLPTLRISTHTFTLSVWLLIDRFLLKAMMTMIICSRFWWWVILKQVQSLRFESMNLTYVEKARLRLFDAMLYVLFRIHPSL